jgi:integrase
VVLAAPLATTLKEHRLRSPYSGDDDFVFPNATGERPLSYAGARGYFDRLTDRTGVNEGKRRLTLHDLRHTFGSMLVASGSDIAHVAGQIGDTIETTYRTYISEYEAVAHADRIKSVLGKSLERIAGNSLQM